MHIYVLVIYGWCGLLLHRCWVQEVRGCVPLPPTKTLCFDWLRIRSSIKSVQELLRDTLEWRRWVHFLLLRNPCLGRYSRIWLLDPIARSKAVKFCRSNGAQTKIDTVSTALHLVIQRCVPSTLQVGVRILVHHWYIRLVHGDNDLENPHPLQHFWLRAGW